MHGKALLLNTPHNLAEGHRKIIQSKNYPPHWVDFTVPRQASEKSKKPGLIGPHMRDYPADREDVSTHGMTITGELTAFWLDLRSALQERIHV